MVKAHSVEIHDISMWTDDKPLFIQCFDAEGKADDRKFKVTAVVKDGKLEIQIDEEKV